MGVNIADALCKETVPGDELQDLAGVRDRGRGKVLKRVKNGRSVREAAQGNFTNDEGMAEDRALLKQLAQHFIVGTKMIDLH